MRHRGEKPGPAAGRKMRVLLVDDCDELLSLMTCVLLENGFDVGAAPDARQGYRMALEGGFDLLVTDIYMPDVKGNSLIGMLRVSGFKAPIIVVSGYVGCLEASRLKELGVVRVMPKPFKIASLLEAVRQALDVGGAEELLPDGEERIGLIASG